MTVKFRIKQDFDGYLILERKIFGPFWETEYHGRDINDIKRMAKRIDERKKFKKKVLVEGTIDDILAFGEQ